MLTLKENEEILLTIIGETYASQPNYKEIIKVERPDSNITKENDVALPKGAKLTNLLCIDQKDYERVGLTSRLFEVAFKGLQDKGYLIGKESYMGDYPHQTYTDRNGKQYIGNVEFDIKEFWGNYRIEVCDNFLTQYNNFKKQKKEKGPDGRIKIFFSHNKGFYYESSTEKYPIKGSRKDLVIELNKRSSIEINENTAKMLGYENKRDIYGYIKKINNAFRKKVGFNKYDIILKVETGGYRLNEDNFNITFV